MTFIKNKAVDIDCLFSDIFLVADIREGALLRLIGEGALTGYA